MIQFRCLSAYIKQKQRVFFWMGRGWEVGGFCHNVAIILSANGTWKVTHITFSNTASMGALYLSVRTTFSKKTHIFNVIIQRCARTLGIYLTVADARLLSVKVKWWGSHLLKNLEVRILLRNVRGCLTTHTWMSPSCNNLYLIPLLQLSKVLLHDPAPNLLLLFPSGAVGADISPSKGLFSSDW